MKMPGQHSIANDPSNLAESLNSFAGVDVGSPQLTGSAKRLEDGWEITAGGADIWEKTDQCHFVNKEFAGDFDISVRVENFTSAHLYSKAGLMIRESLDADSPHVFFLVFSNNEPRNNNLGGYEMQFRRLAGGECQAIYPLIKPPAPPEFSVAFPHSWLRVRRCGDLFSAFASSDGKVWKLYGEQRVALTRSSKVGPALTSHNPGLKAKAVFRNYTENK
jgi:regulation of enolase protein 1 (concanavalin A-like superfamily)